MRQFYHISFFSSRGSSSKSVGSIFMSKNHLRKYKIQQKNMSVKRFAIFEAIVILILLGALIYNQREESTNMQQTSLQTNTSGYFLQESIQDFFHHKVI